MFDGSFINFSHYHYQILTEIWGIWEQRASPDNGKCILPTFFFLSSLSLFFLPFLFMYLSLSIYLSTYLSIYLSSIYLSIIMLSRTSLSRREVKWKNIVIKVWVKFNLLIFSKSQIFQEQRGNSREKGRCWGLAIQRVAILRGWIVCTCKSTC